MSPLSADLAESVSTLEFGARAMRVQNRPRVHQITDYRGLALRLQVELDRKVGGFGGSGRGFWEMEMDRKVGRFGSGRGFWAMELDRKAGVRVLEGC